MMWPPGRFQPHIIFRKYIIFSGLIPFPIHINTLNKVAWNVSSQALLRIHVCHTRLILHQIFILQNYSHVSASRQVKYTSVQQCNTYSEDSAIHLKKYNYVRHQPLSCNWIIRHWNKSTTQGEETSILK